MRSGLIVAVVGEGVDVSAESALEDVFGLDFNALGALANLVANLCAIVADVVLGVVFGELLKELLGALKVLLHEDLGVVVRALGTFLAEAVHVVPAELAHDVLELAGLAVEAEPHVEVGAALVDVPEGAVLALLALLPHEIRADLKVVAEVALVPVPARPHALEFVARLDLALIVGVRAIVGQPALAVDELLADSVGGELVVVGRGDWLLAGGRGIIEGVVVARVAALLLWVHYNNNQIINRIKIASLHYLPYDFISHAPGLREQPRRIIKLNPYIIRMKQQRSSGKIRGAAWLLLVILVSITVHYLSNDGPKGESTFESSRRLYTVSTTRLPIVSTYCKNGAVTVTDADRSKNAGYKSSVSSYMKANATRLVVDLVNSNIGDFMTEIQINGTGTIVFIAPFFIGLALLILSFPCLLCCCTCPESCPPKCCRGKNPNYSNSELTWPTVLLVLVCLIVIGTVIPSMTNAKPFFAEFNCQAAKFIDDFYNGNPTKSQAYFFSGVAEVRHQLTTVMSPNLGAINTQISKFNSSGGSTMATIISDTNAVLAGLQSVSRSDSLQFTQTYNEPLDSSITTGTFSSVLGPLLGTHGVNSSYLGSLYSYITNYVLANMTSITTAASGVTPHLTAGDMGAQITIADTALGVIQGNLDSMNSQFENVLSLLASIDSYNINYSVIFYGVILAQALLILITIIFMKCFKMISCRYFIYFICLIMFFFCLVLFFCTVILALLTPTLYYTCQYFQNTFTSPTAFTSMILTLQGASYTSLANQFSQCFGGSNNFMTAINPTLQSYISQLKTSVFNSHQYDFTAMTSTLNQKITTMQTSIDDIGLGHLPDFDITTARGQAQISNFNSIASKTTFSTNCPISSFNLFYQDVWVPGLSSSYQQSVSCLNKVGIDNTTCINGIDDVSNCSNSRCIDTFSIISQYYRTGNIANIGNDADSRYGNCLLFKTYLNNFYNNYVKLVVDNIGNTVDDGANSAKLAGRFNINAKTPINSLISELNGNVNTLFTQIYNNLTITNNLQSIFDPSVGLITGLDCRLLSEDGVAAKESLCITSFNRIYFTLVTMAILAFSLFLGLCCIVCFNVRHYRKSIQKEQSPGRIFPLDETSSEIHLK